MRVLGISPMHDSSVAIVHNANIEYFCKEERLTRKKREGHPFKSLQNALDHAKGEIDYFVISSPTKTPLKLSKVTCLTLLAPPPTLTAVDNTIGAEGNFW